MKAIKITETNAEAINAAIAEVEGRASSRTCNFDDCQRAVWLAEKHPALHLLPKKDHVGTRASYQQGVSLPNSYKYRAEATALRIERRSTGWFLIGVHRGDCSNNQPEKVFVSLSKAQADEATRRFAAQFSVRAE